LHVYSNKKLKKLKQTLPKISKLIATLLKRSKTHRLDGSSLQPGFLIALMNGPSPKPQAFSSCGQLVTYVVTVATGQVIPKQGILWYPQMNNSFLFTSI
jgi:hypothetical protein